MLKFDPSGDFLAVGSHDNFIDIYDTAGLMDRTAPPALLATCKGHSSFIKHLDWSSDGAYLRSNCGAYELLFWDREGNQLPGGASALRDTAWSGTTCSLGWDVQGIWPKGAMGCQINALAKSPQVGGGEAGDYSAEGVIATADDFGQVKLFRWPLPICTIPLGRSNPGLTQGTTEGKAFKGHSSHVANVLFTSEFATDAGTEFCLSVGGNDDCAIVWKHIF